VSLTEDFFDPLRACCAVADIGATREDFGQGEAQSGAMRWRDIAVAICLVLLVLPVVVLIKLAALIFRFRLGSRKVLYARVRRQPLGI
jgi:hypothetical protein